VSNDSKKTVLIRGPDGKLHRSLSQRAPIKPLVPLKASHASTMVVKEIDVDELKKPLSTRLLSGQIRPDCKKPSPRHSSRSLPSPFDEDTSVDTPDSTHRTSSQASLEDEVEVQHRSRTLDKSDRPQLRGNRQVSAPCGDSGENSRLIAPGGKLNRYGTVVSLDISRFSAALDEDSDDEVGVQLSARADERDLAANFGSGSLS
jgi:hypothetical protein